jgi:hypothetical protein
VVNEDFLSGEKGQEVKLLTLRIERVGAVFL